MTGLPQRAHVLFYIYYIDTVINTRIFYFTKKIISSSRAVKILFLSFTCKDIGVTMVINMIRQLQESFPLRHTAGSLEISLV